MGKIPPLISSTRSSEGYITMKFTYNTANPTVIQRVIDYLLVKQFRLKNLSDTLIPVSDVEVTPIGTKTDFAVRYIISHQWN